MPYERLLRPLLFRLDPETAHNLAIGAIAKGLVRGKLLNDPRLRVRLPWFEAPNPLGLAAGVDKNALAASRWAQMGFGFAEIGTVTAHAQPGNPRPRLFRFPNHKAVVNRMGFNNEGADAAARRLKGVRAGIPLGVNLGKSKVTPNEEAASDYLKSFRLLAPLGDYVVVNVSSPNTPGLRDLQSVEALRDILTPLMAENEAAKPIFVKLAPDLHPLDMERVAGLAVEMGLAGIIATNTTLSRDGVPEAAEVAGGLSGAPLKARSDEALALLRRVSPLSLRLIGVGGVFTGDDLWDKLSRGACLAQTYTGWVYRGPQMPYLALTELLVRMEKEGVRSVEEIAG